MKIYDEQTAKEIGHTVWRGIKKYTLIGPIIDVIGWFEKNLGKDPSIRTTSIAIIGMEQAGKTTMWNMLRYGNVGNADSTQIEKIPSFEMNRADGSSLKVKVEEQKDIGGGNEHVRKYYPELIKQDSFTYFLFDINELKRDKQSIRSRLLYIYDKIVGENIQGFGLTLVATHYDKFQIQDIFKAQSIVYKTLGLDDFKVGGEQVNFDQTAIKILNTQDLEAIEDIKNEIINPKS